MEKECSLRHENGNCFHVGGFCTAVPEYLCKALRSAYERGKADAEAYIFHCGDTDEPMTHYDEIRSMSVEKMAKWLKANAGCNRHNDKEWCYRHLNCEQCWAEYLNMEVTE